MDSLSVPRFDYGRHVRHAARSPGRDPLPLGFVGVRHCPSAPNLQTGRDIFSAGIKDHRVAGSSYTMHLTIGPRRGKDIDHSAPARAQAGRRLGHVLVRTALLPSQAIGKSSWFHMHIFDFKRATSQL